MEKLRTRKNLNMENIDTLIQRSQNLKERCEAFQNKLDHALMINKLQAQILSQYELELMAIKYEHKLIAKRIKRQLYDLENNAISRFK